MGPLLLALTLIGSVVLPAWGGEEVIVLQETRTREPGKKTVLHLAVLKNVSSRPIQSLRVTVELYDYFGRLLWARTVTPAPARLAPGDTATLSLTTPHLEAYRKSAYRFEYRPR